jgi:hypothetical protein
LNWEGYDVVSGHTNSFCEFYNCRQLVEKQHASGIYSLPNFVSWFVLENLITGMDYPDIFIFFSLQARVG